jgi:hypothetical protein
VNALKVVCVSAHIGWDRRNANVNVARLYFYELLFLSISKTPLRLRIHPWAVVLCFLSLRGEVKIFLLINWWDTLFRLSLRWKLDLCEQAWGGRSWLLFVSFIFRCTQQVRLVTGRGGAPRLCPLYLSSLRSHTHPATGGTVIFLAGSWFCRVREQQNQTALSSCVIKRCGKNVSLLLPGSGFSKSALNLRRR